MCPRRMPKYDAGQIDVAEVKDGANSRMLNKTHLPLLLMLPGEYLRFFAIEQK